MNYIYIISKNGKLFLLLLAFLWANCVSAQVITTFAGTGNQGYSGDGSIATKAELDGPSGAAIDDSGNFYIADYHNNVIRKIVRSTGDVITTFAGTGEPGYKGDGGPATAAKLSGPSGLIFDNEGNLYIADHNNNCIRKINKNGIISTVAGTGEEGFTGNGEPAIKAKLQGPLSVAVDKAGNLYIADCENNCIRKVTKSGIIVAFAGDGLDAGTGAGNYWGDGGPAINAEFNKPKSLAIDAIGNMYISDCFNHCVRMINTKGIITTIAGTGTGGFNKDSVAATEALLNYPDGVMADNRGYIYISDHNNQRIRCINNKGVITTIAGTGKKAFSGDGGQANLAEINSPSFVILDNIGNLYIGDKVNNRVRVISCNPATGSITNAVLPCLKIQPKSD